MDALLNCVARWTHLSQEEYGIPSKYFTEDTFCWRPLQPNWKPGVVSADHLKLLLPAEFVYDC